MLSVLDSISILDFLSVLTNAMRSMMKRSRVTAVATATATRLNLYFNIYYYHAMNGRQDAKSAYQIITAR